MRIKLLLLTGLAMGLVLPRGAVAAGAAVTSKPKTVDCDAGQTIAAALSKLDKRHPNTLTVSGTCRENVTIRGFDDLRIVAPGAVLIPATVGLEASALEVVGSRFVTVDGLTIHGGDVERGISLHSCTHCRVTNCVVDGSTVQVWGILAFEGSSVTVSACEVLRGGLFGMSVYDSSALIEDTVFDGSYFDGSYGPLAGINVGGGSAILRRLVVRNYGFGISAGGAARVEIGDDRAEGPQDSTVTIENNRYNGVFIGAASVVSTYMPPFNRLRVLGNGGGIMVDTGGIFTAYWPIDVTNNTGDGIHLSHHALASLTGPSTVSGNGGAGLAVHTDSMVIGPQGSTTLNVSGNQGSDLRCDSTSMITNAARITGSSNVSCAKRWDEDWEP